jgi:hypothetical protein
MTHKPLWLLGTLASHVRGKVISDATGATATDSLPTGFGLCLAFGSEFQGLDSVTQKLWADWTVTSGRSLLLIPPFELAACDVPAAWRAFRPQKPEANPYDSLGKLVAGEVRFEISGGLQSAVEVVGEWKTGKVHTAYYRKHPHSGLFAITCLPLWSLTVLDHRETLQAWLMTLGNLAGEPAQQVETEAASTEFEPNRDHFALMLHLCEREYRNTDEALDCLKDSAVFAIPDESARRCILEMQEAGLVDAGKLTEHGRSILLASPYAVYATAMERNR